MKASPASILSLLVAAAVAPGGAREQREPAPDLLERIRALTAERINGQRRVQASDIDVDQPMAAQGCSDDDIFEIIIDLEATYRIEIDEIEYGSDGNTTNKKLTVRDLARIVASHL